MNNKSYFKPLEDYFEQISKSSSHIGEFVPMSIGSMEQIIADRETKYPLLSLVDYEGKLNENRQRTIATRTVTFAILYTCDTDDKAEQRQRAHDAEGVGLQILAKIDHDSFCGAVDWMHKAFRKESVNFTPLEYVEFNNLHGIEFSFDLDIKNPLHYDAVFWDTVE